MFKSIEYINYILAYNTYTYKLTDSEFIDFVAFKPASTKKLASLPTKVSMILASIAASIIGYHLKNLPVARNIAILLTSLKQFDLNFLKPYLSEYFAHPVCKDLNINYLDYHDDIMKEFNKLNVLS